MHHIRRLQVVDGLRAYAVIAVVIFHSFHQALPGGYIGVDIFFVISGFVIALRYLDELRDRTITFGEFFRRRIRRLVPAYFLMVLLTALAASVVMTPKYLTNFGGTLASQAVYLQNVVLWSQGDYFDSALSKPLLHTWSLAVEEQFYFCFPFVILLFRWKAKSSLIFLVMIAAGSIAAGIGIGGISPKTAFYWLPFRAWEFLIGIFTAMLFRKQLAEKMTQSLANVIAAASLCAIVVACAFFDREANFPGTQSLLAVFGTAAICLVQTRLSPSIALVFTTRPAQHFGRISYSWYLWHWPPVSFFFLFTGRAPEGLAAAAIFLAGYMAGALSHQYIEQWGQASQSLRHPRSAYGLVAIFSITAALVGFVFVASSGLLNRYEPELSALYAAQMDRPSYRCPLLRRLALHSAEICRLNDFEGPGGVLIMGDSHADAMKAALVNLGSASGTPVYLVKQNCRLVDYGNERDCTLPGWERVMNDLRTFGVSRLIVISHWSESFDRRTFKDALARVGRSRVKTYLQDSTPESPDLNPASYFDTSADWDSQSAYSRSEHDLMRQEQSVFLRQAVQAYPNIRLIDPLPVLCPDKQCLFAKDGVPLYSDDNHLSTRGAAYLAPLFEEALKP